MIHADIHNHCLPTAPVLLHHITAYYIILCIHHIHIMYHSTMSVQEGARWLREWCHKVQAGPGSADAGGSDDSLALAVSRVLLATRSADEAAAELFDLLGDTSFDAIQQILEHRYEITMHQAAAVVHSETFH